MLNIANAPFEPQLAAALAAGRVQNGALASSAIAVQLDVWQTQSHWSLCPSMGVGGLIGTTAREMRAVAAPFIRFARPWIVAAGSGTVTFASVSGVSGTVAITVALDSSNKDPWDADTFVGASVLTLSSGDICRDIRYSVVASSGDVKCFGWGLRFEGASV